MLTPEERRGALLVLGLVLIGAAWDACGPWRTPAPAGSPRNGHETAVPAVSAVQEPPGAAQDTSGAARAHPEPETAPRVISLNRATAAELEALPGIGPVLARRIIAHRDRFGLFRSPEELRAVRGVGPRLMARVRGRLSTGP